MLADGKCGNWGVIFSAVVSEVEISCGPEISKLLLQLSAAEPVEFHVHGLGFAWNYGFFGYP